EIPHHRAALAFGIALDGEADIAGGRARTHGGDASQQALIGDLDQALGLAGYRADAEHPAGIAMPAIEDQGVVDIDDVAFAQRLVVWDAVTDDVVDRGADRFGVAAVEQRRRIGT